MLVIDDSLMLLSFVKEILTEANYEVTTAATAAESLSAAKSDPPDLILLDYVLPDMKGNEVSRKLLDESDNSKDSSRLHVGFRNGLAEGERREHGNVIGFLNKPFTSDLLIKTVETHMPKSPDEISAATKVKPCPHVDARADPQNRRRSHCGAAICRGRRNCPRAKDQGGAADRKVGGMVDGAAQAANRLAGTRRPQRRMSIQRGAESSRKRVIADAEESNLPDESVTGGAYFCGDTSFFSLNRALQTIAKEKLTGSLRSFWNKDPVELLAQDGRIGLVTTRDPELYCPEAPITLVNVDAQRIEAARSQQRETGCPLFITLSQENLILREPAMQLVQHYGQKLFAQLWTTKRVRFVFEQNPLPSYAADIPTEADIDNWTLATLRSIQFQDLGSQGNYDGASIPAYTKDGFERVQNLRLTVAEAQFASQFNGVRSIQQIAKNLRLDVKFARLTLFRFLALEIVECWPPTVATKPERKGVFQRLTRTIGIGE